MRLAVIVPIGDRPGGGDTLRGLGEWRRHGHRVIVVDGGGGGTSWADRGLQLADRVVYAPCGWSRQANAGSRAPEVECADALVFLPEGVQLPPQAGRSIARALANSTSPWGRFDIRYRPVGGVGRWPLALAAAVANTASRLTGICTREQAVFVSRGAFLALQGYTPVDGRADRAADALVDADFSRRARQLGAPIILHDTALVPAPAPALGALLRATWQRECTRVAVALGWAGLH